MNLLEMLGCIGGTLFLISWIIKVIHAVVELIRKYEKYERFYEDASNERDDEPAKKMGFKSKEEQDKEELDELKKAIEKLEIKDEGYFDMYWQTEPVDNEFIEEEEYEDWEDKYPNLHVER